MGDYQAAASYANGLMTAPPRPRPTQSQFNPAVQNAHDNLLAYRQSWGAQNAGKFGGDPNLAYAALAKDPEFQRLQSVHQQAQEAHVSGLQPGELGQINAAAQYLSNQASAVTTDAGTRRIEGTGKAARDTGQGKAFEGEGNLSNARAGDVAYQSPYNAQKTAAETQRIKDMTPADAAAQYANALATNAQGKRTLDLIPGEVAMQGANVRRNDQTLAGDVAAGQAGARRTNAEAGSIEQDTRMRPDIVKAAQEANRLAVQRAEEDRQLQNDKTRAGILKDSTAFDPLTGVTRLDTGERVGRPAVPAGGAGSRGGASTAPPATLNGPGGAALPDKRGFLGKAADATIGAAYGINPAADEHGQPLGVGAAAAKGARNMSLGPVSMAAAFLNGAYKGWNTPQASPLPSTTGAAMPGAGGAGSAPSASPVPQRFKDPQTGQMYERVGNLLYRLLSNGTRQLVTVGQ